MWAELRAGEWWRGKAGGGGGGRGNGGRTLEKRSVRGDEWRGLGSGSGRISDCAGWEGEGRVRN